MDTGIVHSDQTGHKPKTNAQEKEQNHKPNH